jgi:lipopolysaccharide transport system ATP-binding protein
LGSQPDVSDDAAIELTGVGKQYQRGGAAPVYRTIRESITNFARRPFRGASAEPGGAGKQFWALRDLDLKVGHGEVVGVIGRNGSGKSTLLKLIAGITLPTAGEIRLAGAVTPLLQIGAGFHPELTGRENVYLNAAILGLSRREVDRRMSSIIEFSGIADFIDTEVRRYSSGMHVRLAFAVAVQTDPEILLVDEVLAVGDADFQKRCLEKVEEIAAGGTTVLLVTHNMALLTRFCERAILLERGRMIAEGGAEKVASQYLESGLGLRAERVWPDPERRPGGDIARVIAVRILDPGGEPAPAFDVRRPIKVEFEFEVLREAVVVPGFTLHNEQQLHLWTAADHDADLQRSRRAPGFYRSSVVVPGNLLADGTYRVGIQLRTFEPQRLEADAREAIAFTVMDSIVGDAARGHWRGNWAGAVRPRLDWTTGRLDEGEAPIQPSSTKSRVARSK